MLNLYIDFDGVIVNTIDITYKMLAEKGIRPKETEKCMKFYQELDWEDVLKQCEPINNAWDCISKIIESRKFNVAILTHVSSINEAEAKVHFVRQHLADTTIITVPKSISKTKMLKAAGSILVDDFVSNLEEWKEAGGYGVRFDLDMDGKGFEVIDRLDVLMDMLD